MRVVVDNGKCTGLGLCEAAAPDVFEIQDDGSLKLLVEYPAEEQRTALEEAVASCPTEALRIVEG